MDTITQRTVAARDATTHKPAGVPASVFEAGKMAKPARTVSFIDPNAVTIKKGVPIPPCTAGPNAGDRYGKLLDRMGKGDCVELTEKQSKSLLARGRKLGVKLTVRNLGSGVFCVWRV